MKKLIITLTIILLATGAIAQQGLQQLRINDFSKGMNSFDRSDLIEPSQGASMVNVVINRFGRLTKRKGQNLFNADVGSTAFRGLGRFDPDRTTSYMVAASGTDVIASLSNETTWRFLNAASQLTAGKDTEFVQANDLLFVLNGFDNTSFWTGSTFQTADVYPSSPPSATTGAWLRNYLFLGGATTETDWVYFSNNLDPLTFDASDIIKINTGDGQAIQRLIPYRLNELIVYKERSIFVLDIEGATLSGWTVQPISKVIGTPAPRSVVSLGNDQWFLSSEPVAIRSLQRTEFDKILVDIVSKPIQDIFEGTNTFGFSLNKTHMSKACAILFDNKYIIAIPTGTSTVNNTVLVFDFLTGGWYIIKGWYPSSWIEFNNRLFYTDANDGSVLEVFTGTIGDYAEGPETRTYGSEPTIGIEFVYVTKSLDFDKPENFKILDALEVQFEPTGNYSVETLINYDNDGWDLVGDTNLAGNSLTLSVTLPSALANGGVARETFHTQKYNEFRAMQAMIRNRASQQTVELHRMTLFSDPQSWRRE